MQNRGMVAISEVSAYLFQTVTGQLARQKHGNATCPDNSALSRGPAEIARADSEIPAHVFGNRSQMRFGRRSPRSQATANVLLVDFTFPLIGSIID
jgi:hypothetical protein